MQLRETLPQFIVVGGMKCGTTSLDHYLKAHPEIHTPERDVDFFSLHHDQGVDWYRARLRGGGPGVRVRGETSVSYTKFPYLPEVPERMHRLLPDAKLIYVVRDPIARIVSHYLHGFYAGEEEGGFEEVLRRQGMEGPYVTLSRYHFQLSRYLPYYPKERILVLALEDLRDLDTRVATLQRAFSFLGVEPCLDLRAFSQVKHESRRKGRKTALGRLAARLPLYQALGKRAPAALRDLFVALTAKKIATPVPSRELRQALVEELRPDAEALRELAGREFAGWSV